MPCSYSCVWVYNTFIRIEILLVLLLFCFPCQSFLTMSERRALDARAPSNLAVPVEAFSQPPRKRYRLLIQCSLQSRQMQLILRDLHLRQQWSTSALNVGSSAHTAEPPGSAHAARPCTKKLPLSPEILDLILQGVMNAVTKRLASIPSANKISSTASVTSPSALATLHAAPIEAISDAVSRDRCTLFFFIDNKTLMPEINKYSCKYPKILPFGPSLYGSVSDKHIPSAVATELANIALLLVKSGLSCFARCRSLPIH